MPLVGLGGVFAAPEPSRGMPAQVVRSAEVAPPDRFRLCRQADTPGRRPDQDRNDDPLCEGTARRCGDDQDLRGERSGRLLPVRRGLFSFSVGAVKSVFLMFFCRKRNGSVFSSNVLKTKTGRNF